VSKQAVPAHQTRITFDICAEDQTGEDVELPPVVVKL
jgi:ubiquitin-activating enzyme E1